MSASDQVTLTPSFTYTDSPDTYADAAWRWEYGGEVSEWFTSRDEATADAAEKHPGLGIG